MLIKKIIFEGKAFFNVDPENSDLPSAVLDQAIKEQQWQDIRGIRNKLMSDVDHTQMPDSPISPEKKAEFAEYRQALRDIPQSFTDPDAVVWPVKPAL